MKTIEELQRRVIELDIEAKERQKERQKEADQRQKEFDKGMQELRASQAQTEKLVHETSQQIKKTDEQMKKTDEQMKKTDEQMKKTDEKLDRIAKMVGGISRSQGAVAEEFFFNSISANPVLDGITYDHTDKNLHRKKGNTEDEFDIMLVNGNDIAIIEVKYKVHPKDIQKLISKKYENFQALFPEYKDYHHHLAIATFNISDELKNMAKDENITVIQRKDVAFEG